MLKNQVIKKIKILGSTISPVMLSKVLYRRSFGKKLNLKNPTTFNEKLMYLKLNEYKDDELVTVCADKLKVREYIKQCNCEKLLNELLYVYDSPKEIDFEVLPERFVLKCNHGAGYNIICTDKEKLNKKITKKKLRKWLNSDYWKIASELQYKNIPKKIICEKYLEANNKGIIEDYKIYCFNGVAKLVMVCLERDTTNTKYYYFDREWNFLRINKCGEQAPKGFKIDKPNCIDEMFEYAEILAKPFKFVRVDFYNYNNKPVFGELTFTPSACLDTNYTEMAENKLGDMIDLKVNDKIRI